MQIYIRTYFIYYSQVTPVVKLVMLVQRKDMHMHVFGLSMLIYMIFFLSNVICELGHVIVFV